MRLSVAVIGSGISGLGAAWALHRDHDVTVFEKDFRIGGHSNTVDVRMRGTEVPVDTGFIVYNEQTYPNLTRLFDLLDVPTEPSDMSFSFSLDRDFEYGTSFAGVAGRPSNLLAGRFRTMLRDIGRFRRIGEDLVPAEGEDIDTLLRRHGFGAGFREDYLFPMTGAIWSASGEDIRRFPAGPILRFLSNHGLIRIKGRPKWRTVTGGSREYVRRLTAGFTSHIKLGTPVVALRRTPGGVQVHTPEGRHRFDHVILATHSDQALAILGDDATEEERRMLGTIRYRPNRAVLHSDTRLMPASRGVWASWNALARTPDRFTRAPSVTYWMNRLQNISGPTEIFVSLNPIVEPDPDQVHASFCYDHPQFDDAAIRAQRELASIQGRGGTWFAGAYLGYGFHEDGLQSGLNIAGALGSPPPWQGSGSFQPVSSAVIGSRVGAVAP